MARLAGQRVLVTGAAGGIGGAVARRCAEEGARVAGCDLAGAELVCDIAEERQVEELVAAHGPFDAVVHAAALLGGSGRFPDVTTEAFDCYIRINLRGGLARAVPLGGPGEPEAVAEAALYLVDPRTRFVTGATLAVDGGITAYLRQT